MYQVANFTDNDDVKIIARAEAPSQVIEYQRDLSVTPGICPACLLTTAHR